MDIKSSLAKPPKLNVVFLSDDSWAIPFIKIKQRLSVVQSSFLIFAFRNFVRVKLRFFKKIKLFLMKKVVKFADLEIGYYFTKNLQTK